MKLVHLLITLLLSIVINGQSILDSLPINKETGIIEFTLIDSLPVPKAVLQNRSMFMVQQMFGIGSKKAIQAFDKDEGYIITKGSIIYFYKEINRRGKHYDTITKKENADVTLTLFCKDNKYKTIISDINLHGSFIWDGEPITESGLNSFRKAITENAISNETQYSSLSRFEGFVYQLKYVLSFIKNTMSIKAGNEF